MATIGPQLFKNMMNRREFLDFTRDFNDPRQWPALGEATDNDQLKKKLPIASSYNPASYLSASPFVPRQKCTSEGDSSSASTSKCSSLSSGIGSNRKSESDSSTSEALATCSPLEDTPTHEFHSPEADAPVSNEADQPRRNSSDETANCRKKGAKTKWIPLEIPPPRLSMQQKLQQRYQKHRETAAAQLGGVMPGWRARVDGQPLERPRPPPRTYGYTGSYYSYSNNAPSRPPYHPSSVASRPDSCSQTSNSQRFYRPRPKFSRKIQGFRNREIMYDSEFAGHDGDQFSDGADDMSLAEGYDYYYKEGSRTPSGEWSGYYAPPAGSHLDTPYMSMPSDGFSTSGDEYGNFDYYGFDSGMESGYYFTEEEEVFTPDYVPTSEAELKECIKTQIEYYFSAENLQKDFFLRRNMAEDGSVQLSLVASFQRVRSLSQDVYMILEAVSSSERLELMEGFMVRSRDEPESWPIKEDDETGSYYYGEMPLEDNTNWQYYTDTLGASPSEQDERESGHCDDDYDGGEEDGEDDGMSVVSSELSDLSTGIQKTLSDVQNTLSEVPGRSEVVVV